MISFQKRINLIFLYLIEGDNNVFFPFRSENDFKYLGTFYKDYDSYLRGYKL